MLFSVLSLEGATIRHEGGKGLARWRILRTKLLTLVVKLALGTKARCVERAGKANYTMRCVINFYWSAGGHEPTGGTCILIGRPASTPLGAFGPLLDLEYLDHLGGAEGQPIRIINGPDDLLHGGGRLVPPQRLARILRNVPQPNHVPVACDDLIGGMGCPADGLHTLMPCIKSGDRHRGRPGVDYHDLAGVEGEAG